MLLLLVVVAAVVAAAAARPVGATNECRGLMICVRVHGPWVVVPSSLTTPRARVTFQLSCPRSYAIGGLDAELSDRGIDVDFRGKLGSPVGPGVTTARSALFTAAYVGAAGAAPTFRPHLGCIPVSGGGTGPVPFRRAQAVFPPGEPTIRRVRTVRLRAGNVRAVAACGNGERLVSAWHAVAFYTSAPPSASLIRSARTSQTIRGSRVDVQVRGGFELATVRAIVQVGAVCGGAA